MFDGVTLPNGFDGQGTSLGIDLPHERLDLLTGSTSFSLHFNPGFPCEFASSVTLTVLLESPSPSANVFVVSPIWTWPEPQAEIAFPSGKACLSGAGLREAGQAERAGLGAETGLRSAVGDTTSAVRNEIELIDSRLQPIATTARQTAALTERQEAAAGLVPRLKAWFLGERRDYIAKQLIESDPVLGRMLDEGVVKVSPRFLPKGSVMPDVVYTKAPVWWDFTTPLAWDEHVIRYTGIYGEGIPIFY